MKQEKQIGTEHEALASTLFANFGKVRRIADREFAGLIDYERDKLHNWRARIAGIGQVKAGKSTFLSALIDKPGFLPSEVNPWTAVITNLHFGHPDDPEEGGVFHFFAEDDWLRIIEGNAETRELAQDLLPGFDSETLREQVETMRARAKQRLGNFYSVLLGGSHKYDRVTREMLDRYVCTGGELEKSSQRTGRYSDITERADIYLPKGRWAIPAVVTDTPGVNDPFLVRDEFTCRSLLNSEIFILILSAHQALTDVDIALVRMVAEHPDKQILVVINRIDELDEFATTAPKVKDDVAKRLVALAPDTIVEVVLASAAWAEMLTGEGAPKEEIAEIANTEEMSQYLRGHYGAVPADPEERLWHASGLKHVGEAIERAINGGGGRRILQEQSQALGSLIANIRNHLKTARHNAVRMKKKMQTDGAYSEAAQLTIKDQAVEAEKLAEDLSEKFAQIRVARDELVDNSWRSARRELDLIVVEFIDRQSDGLRQIIKGQQADRTFGLETDGLRLQLEERARESYRVARQNLDLFLDKSSDEIQQMTASLFGDEAFNTSLCALPHDTVMPIVAETTKTLTLDLVTSRGWRFWANSRMNEAEALRALKEVIRSEFYASVESMSGLVHEALVARGFEALRRVESMTEAMIKAARQRGGEMSPSANGLDQKQLVQKFETSIAEIDQKLASLSEIDTRIPDANESGLDAAADSA